MISIRDLHKTYTSRKVLAGLDADVEAGSIVAIVGGSGSGKSTLLRCLNGLETFEQGTIDIAGHRLTPGPARASLDILRKRVGMVFQDYQLFPHLSALENVSLAPRVVEKRSRVEAEALGLDWLARVGLADRARSKPSELSGGQRQRVALARALCQGVSVLLLDEPTSALDPTMRAEITATLAGLAQTDQGGTRLTFVIVTHDMRLASGLASELWVLDAGKVVERGAPAEIIRSPQSRVAREYLSSGTSN